MTYTLAILLPAGAIFSLRSSLPNADISLRHPMVDSILRIYVGNVFSASSSTAVLITMNRYFDTSSDWVSSDSLVSQLVKTSFPGRREELRQYVLSKLGCEHECEWPVGKIVRVDTEQAAYLLMAVADRNDETRSSVAVDAVWLSLSRLWQYARRNNLSRLRVPVVGSGFARAQVGRGSLLVLLLTSFLTSAMEMPICDLEIVLHPSDADPDLLELSKSYCELLGYKTLDKRSFTERDLSPAKS